MSRTRRREWSVAAVVILAVLIGLAGWWRFGGGVYRPKALPQNLGVFESPGGTHSFLAYRLEPDAPGSDHLWLFRKDSLGTYRIFFDTDVPPAEVGALFEWISESQIAIECISDERRPIRRIIDVATILGTSDGKERP